MPTVEVMNTSVDAQAISRPVLPLIAEGPLKAHVLSVHERTCNLMTDEGHIIALVTPSIGPGPFHVLLSREIAWPQWVSRRSSAWLTSDTVEIGAMHIALEGARVWDPIPDWPLDLSPDPLCSRVIAPLLLSVPVGDRLSRLIRHRIELGLERLVQGLQSAAEEVVRQGVNILIGLGPGLTPAGDDVLLGAIAALQAQNADAERELLFPQVARMLTHTTELSALWLEHALQGHFAQSWHDLARAWGEHDLARMQQAARRILHTGATSGFYALLGFYRTLNR